MKVIYPHETRKSQRFGSWLPPPLLNRQLDRPRSTSKVLAQKNRPVSSSHKTPHGVGSQDPHIPVKLFLFDCTGACSRIRARNQDPIPFSRWCHLFSNLHGVAVPQDLHVCLRAHSYQQVRRVQLPGLGVKFLKRLRSAGSWLRVSAPESLPHQAHAKLRHVC